uniref:Fibronectin type III domain n=1 Tax=Schistocephalus solidus TaxID=70667 RepID=A0A0X3PQG5_SCHSO
MSACAIARALVIPFLCFLISTCSGSQAGRFQLMSNTSTKIEMRWNSNYEANNSRYFRVFLNGKIDSTCKHPLGNGTVMCTIDNLIPNTMYEVEVKICPSDEENPKKLRTFIRAKECFYISSSSGNVYG